MSCSLCDDTGWKTVEDAGVRRVVRCDCWRERLVDAFLNDAKIPPRYRRCDLESFRTENDSLVFAVERARAFVEAFPVVDKGLFFLGHPGVGKTHLAVAALKIAIRTKGARGIFFDTRELLRLIRSTYNPLVRTAEMDVLKPVMEADLLVLDDLGAEKTSEWVEETLNLIVNTRYNERRATLFTSNYEARYEPTDELSVLDSLESRVGSRIWSRLHEMCEFVTLKGVDFRMAGPDATPEELAQLDKRARRTVSRVAPRGKGQARAQLRDGASRRPGVTELRWPGGKAGS